MQNFYIKFMLKRV